MEFTLDRLITIKNIEREHFWFRTRLSIICIYLKKFAHCKNITIMDAGCGTGYNLEHWSQYAENVIGFDAHATFLTDKRIVFASDITDIPIGSGAIDIAIALDVIEHVDDRAAIGELYRCLNDGGHLLLTVPGVPWLWSRRDVSAGHKRRYSSVKLKSLVESYGFEVCYFNRFMWTLFPLIAASRLADRIRISTRDSEDRPGGVFNRILLWVSQFDTALIKAGLTLPWGSSFVLVAKKPDLSAPAI